MLLMLICAVLAMPGLAQAGSRVRLNSPSSGATVQVPFYWHPFFYPGPFAYGYPGGLNYAYPGPYVSAGDGAPYSYGYPGPYTYGTWEYSSPNCTAKSDGQWLCNARQRS
jgi:hypothetical protein